MKSLILRDISRAQVEDAADSPLPNAVIEDLTVYTQLFDVWAHIENSLITINLRDSIREASAKL